MTFEAACGGRDWKPYPGTALECAQQALAEYYGFAPRKVREVGTNTGLYKGLYGGSSWTVAVWVRTVEEPL